MFCCCANDSSIVPLDENELNGRREALKNAVMCIGCMRIISVICYVGLFFIVYMNTEGKMSTVLQTMVLAVIVPEVINGILILLGALQEIVFALAISLWLCLLTASYNTVLGILGTLYYVRNGKETIHYLLACIFAFLALSIFTTLLHDLVLIYSFKKTVESKTEF